ncbi:MAG: aminoacyl-tRNA hydrolase [Eggerthellaceae bacterium]|nr:aminoacyl-tRNA hydrolase [Eggerthellaceae bacterium]
MQVIVGLGNPGEEYAHTRHNAGFEVIDLLAKRWGVSYWKNTCGALVGEAKVRLASGDVEKVILAKPQSFMNLSGGPVSRLCRDYEEDPAELIIIHDELDINPGTVRVKKGGGHAGHNGLRSIIEKLGTRDFLRVRTGIGRPPGRMSVVDFVLQAPKKEAKDDFDEACVLAADAVESLLNEGLERTQNAFNR